jgi:excinuclease UvrABC helicase subunit UvrB
MTETDDAKSSSTKLDTNYKDIDKEIKRLTKEMKEYAGDLEFEKAMICRDKIKELEKIRLTIE